jgi:hypothetical protein
MKIDHYSFGRIAIEGCGYDADVILYPDHVQSHWWRREGHRLAKEDLRAILADPPELLVVGTGYYGCMQVPDETLRALRAAGMEVRVSKTSEAVETLSRLQETCSRVVAALHLTC